MQNDNFLWETAEEYGVMIVRGPTKKATALSVRLAENNYIIGINSEKVESETEQEAVFAHELGHCVTDSFYNEHTPLETRGRMEYRADCWMVRVLLPVEKLLAAINSGCRELWQISERLDLPEWVIQKAINIYRCKGLIS